MKKTLLIALLAAGLAGQTAMAAITFGPVATFYNNPNSGTENITSFDWDSAGNLYWMGGSAAGWGNPMNVYRYGGSLAAIHSQAAYAGSWVCSYGEYIYFNEDSNYTYDTVSGGPAGQVFQQTGAWGFTIHDGGLFISGADPSWNNSIFYSPLDSGGNLTDTPVNLGYVGSPSGPIAFDADGNLFYGAGYSDGLIYKYTAAEVAAAIGGTPFGAASAHEFIDFNSHGLAGTTGIDFDNNGNLVASLTSFGSPSKLVSFALDGSGGYLGSSQILAVSDGRMTTVRNRGGEIYFSDEDGVYRVIPEPAVIGLLLSGGGFLLMRRRLQT